MGASCPRRADIARTRVIDSPAAPIEKGPFTSTATFCRFLHLAYKHVSIFIGTRDNVRTDSELIAWLRKNDRQAFAELYERYKMPVYRYCLKMLGEPAPAEDAVQETFLKMYSRIEQLIDPNRLLPWLFSIAHNEVLMHLRRYRRNGLESADDIWEEVTPFDLAVKSETQEIVQRLLGQLREKYREVLILREYDRFSYSEIAAVTGDTESSVKSRLFKARKAMIAELKRYYQ
jgi:RNA polymerase sigma-70 factor (ECF subfamily)